MVKDPTRKGTPRRYKCHKRGKGPNKRRRLIPQLTVQPRDPTKSSLVAVAALKDPTRSVVASRAEDSRVGGSVSAVRPAKVAPPIRSGRLVPTAMAAGARQGVVEEAGLAAQPQAILAAAPRTAPVTTPVTRASPETTSGRLLQLVPAA